VTESIQQEFQRIVRLRVAPLLRSKGFSSQRTTFRRVGREVVQLVALRKSMKSTAGRIVFAVDRGVASIRLLTRSNTDPMTCRIEDCHWHKRLGVDSSSGETWWTITDARSADASAEELVQALEAHGLGELDALCDDRAFRDMWLNGTGPGLTEGQRLLNLSVLLRALGPSAESDTVLDAIRRLAKTKGLPMLVAYLREIGADA
jgi:hypothetical protein